jgi:hypothetical protein
LLNTMRYLKEQLPQVLKAFKLHLKFR